MSRQLIAATALALGALIAAPSFAQAPVPAAGASATHEKGHEKGHGKGHGKGHMAKIDANKDGQVSKAEAANNPRLTKNFDAIDANKDGQLSKDELKAARDARKGK